MDFQSIFIKEVIEKYKIDKLLLPKNVGNGEIENVILSDLRKELDFCFLDIELYPLKNDFLNYIEDFSLQLKAISIPTQKNKVRRIKKKIEQFETTHPKLDINTAKDEIIIEEINKLEWLFSQEEYILAFLKEQKIFINNWVTEKRKEFKEEPIKEWIEKERNKKAKINLINKILKEKENIIISKPSYFYCKIGALFAQNHIYRNKTEDKYGFVYFYKDREFTNANQLSKHIQDKILVTKKSVDQYIRATFQDSETPHNFKYSKTKMDNIIQYCKENNFEILNKEFLKTPHS